MNTLKEAALGACTAFVFMGAIQLIAPAGAMKKSVSYLLGLVFLLILIVPIAGIGGFDLQSITPAVAAPADNTVKMVEGSARYICEAALIDKNISFENIEINADISGDGSISIIRVRVVTPCARSQVSFALEGIVDEAVLEVVNE